MTGLAPVQGFVLCIEEDGCVRLESKLVEADCGGCTDHEDSALPEDLALTLESSEDCPCIDVAVPGFSQDERVQPRLIELKLGAWIALSVARLSQPMVPIALVVRRPPAEIPRPPESVALIRSVVLLV